MPTQIQDTAEIEKLWQAIQSGRVSYSTYVDLQTAISRPIGSIAEVNDDDGTHEDPVSNTTVANKGVYRRAVEGWQWIGLLNDDLLAAIENYAIARFFNTQAEGEAATTTGDIFAYLSTSGDVVYASRTALTSTVIATIPSTTTLANSTGGALLKNAATGATIPAAITGIRTIGYSSRGRGAALYVLDPDQGETTAIGTALIAAAVASGQTSGNAGAAVTALEARFRFKAADNRWFTLAEDFPTTSQFGAVGDAVYSKENATVTGTDDWAAIQACIDYVLYYKKGGRITLGHGMHKITKTLHLGYGNTYTSIDFMGSGVMFAGDAGRGASGIAPTFTNGPAINIQAARNVRLDRFFIGGKLMKHIVDNNFAYLNVAPTLDDTVAANWDSASLAIADKRYAPYAGITIDAYAFDGAAPADPYPDPGRPAYVPGGHLGAYPAALNNMSSDFEFKDMEIQGFTVGVMLNPSNKPTQGDFCKLTGMVITNCKYCFSFGNHQARNTTLANCNFAKYFQAYTNRVHGNKTGQGVGTILNTAFGAGIDVLNIELAYGSSLTLINSYNEAQWRFGSIVTSGNNDSPITVIDCKFALTMGGMTGDAADTRGLPAAHIYNEAVPGSGSQGGAVRFVNGSIQVDKVLSSAGVLVEFDGTKITSNEVVAAPATQYIREGYNATAGVVVNKLNARLYEQRISHGRINLDTGTVQASITNRRAQDSTPQTRVWCSSIWDERLAASLDQLDDDYIPRGRPARVIDKTTFTAYSWSGKELTFEFVGATRSFHGQVYGLGPGGVMHDPVTGSVFFIRSAVEGGGKLTVIAVLQNNYKDDGVGGITRVTAINLATDNWHVAHGRYFTLPYSQLGTITSASNTITAVQNGEGTTLLTGNIVVGDYMEFDAQKSGAFSEAGQLITAFDNAAKTITLSSTANFTENRVRLARFVRQLAANV